MGVPGGISVGSLIVCPELHAAKCGQDVLSKGGNAVDAAIAAAFVQGVENPFACGIGGGISLYHRDGTSGHDVMIKAESALGSLPVPENWVDRGDANDVGYQSIGVPGFVEGCWSTFQQFRSGRFTWTELLEPAIGLARKGVELSALAQRQWDYVQGGDTLRNEPRLQTTPAAMNLFYRDDGSPMEQGETLVQTELADTLERLATEGAGDFYRGQIADTIATDFASNGGLITSKDLRDYAVEIDEPLRGEYRGLTLSAQPFSNGGHLIETFQILEHFDLAALGHNSPEYIDVVSKAMRAARGDYLRVQGYERPEFLPLEMENVGLERAANLAMRIKEGDPLITEAPSGTPKPTRGTTHLHCVDAEGTVVSHNHSIGCGGSGVVTKGLGFLYNNDSNDAGFERPRRFIGGGSPLMFTRQDRPFLVLGAPGGSRIATSIIQSALNVIDFEIDMQTAVTLPRFHSEDRRVVFLEHAFREQVASALRTMGNEVLRNRYHARPQGILWRSDTGALEPGTDPRVGGAIGMFPPYDWGRDFSGIFGSGKPPH